MSPFGIPLCPLLAGCPTPTTRGRRHDDRYVFRGHCRSRSRQYRVHDTVRPPRREFDPRWLHHLRQTKETAQSRKQELGGAGVHPVSGGIGLQKGDQRAAPSNLLHPAVTDRRTEFGKTVMLDHACQTGSHSFAERGDDAYGTPPVAVEALLRVEPLPHRLWEPAAGRGNIVDVLRARGHTVIGSDLVDYGRPDFFSRRDFLMERKVPDGCEAIVSNPPFRLAGQFV